MRRPLATAAILTAGVAAGLTLVRGAGPAPAVASPAVAIAHPPAPVADAAPAPERLTPPPPSIRESSGLAASRARPGWFWTLNDSGGGEGLVRYDPADAGAAQAFTLGGARNADWEDLASFRSADGRDLLLVADVGDNRRNRAHVLLHLLEEPSADADPSAPLAVLLTLPVSFADGPRDCEAVAVDATGGLILLGSKEIDQHGRTHGASGLYALPLPALPASPAGREPLRRVERVATLPTLMPTGMDVSPDGSTLAICTYGDAMVFARGGGGWAEAVAAEPVRPATPPRRQGEAVAFGLDGGSLYFTSEGVNQPTWRVPLD